MHLLLPRLVARERVLAPRVLVEREQRILRGECILGALGTG